MNAQSSSSDTELTPARELVIRLSSSLANEKRELVLFLIDLAQLDSKNLALELGYPSTFACLMGELGLTESSACRRIAAARLLARFPQIAPHLMACRLTLKGLAALKDVLDESNVDAVLEQAAGLSEPEVQKLVMRIRFADAAPPTDVAPGQMALATPPAAAATEDPVATLPSAVESPPRERVEMPEALTLWVGREFREELAAMRALASHVVPGGKTEDVILYALRAQRKVLERRKHGSPKRNSKRPRPSPPPAGAMKGEPAVATSHDTPANPRYVPAEVRREVYEREGGSCAYVGEGGRRCGSTWRLEYQHIVPAACGGPAAVVNITLFCGRHNALQAEHDFGAEHVRRKILERTMERALSALTRLGYRRREAQQAVERAMERLPRGSDLALPHAEGEGEGEGRLGELMRESLRLLAP